MAGYKRKNDVLFLSNMGYRISELETLSDEIIQEKVAKIKEVKVAQSSPSRFADSFQLLRVVVGTSLADIATATDILSINLSRYERGLFEPTLSVAQLIASYFETTVDEMLSLKYTLPRLIQIKEAFCKSHGKEVFYFPKRKEKVYNSKLVIEAIEKEIVSFENDLDMLMQQFNYFMEFIAWRDDDKYTELLSEDFKRKLG